MLVGMGGVLGIKDDGFLYGARCVTGAAFGTPRLVGFIVARQVVLSSIARLGTRREVQKDMRKGIPLVFGCLR